MLKYKKGGFPADGNLFICTSEKEIELVGTLGGKGTPHTSEQISKTIAESIREAVEKEVGKHGKENTFSESVCEVVKCAYKRA